jgi:hypothetical protein
MPTKSYLSLSVSLLICLRGVKRLESLNCECCVYYVTERSVHHMTGHSACHMTGHSACHMTGHYVCHMTGYCIHHVIGPDRVHALCSARAANDWVVTRKSFTRREYPIRHDTRT